jgi:hypothetical protein
MTASEVHSLLGWTIRAHGKAKQDPDPEILEVRPGIKINQNTP